MTDLKFNILKSLYDSYPRRELTKIDILNSLSFDKILIKNALKELQSLKYIKNLTGSDVFKLTELGTEVFEEEQEKGLQLKRYKEEKRRSWIQFWIPVIISLIALFRDEISILVKTIINLCS